MNNNIDKVAWVYIKDRKVLGARSKGKIPFYIPGGKREENETDIETLIREVKEELSIGILGDTAKFIGDFEAQAHGKPEGIMVVMHTYTSEFSGEIIPDQEIEEIGWLTSKDIGTERTSPVDYLILQSLFDEGLID